MNKKEQLEALIRYFSNGNKSAFASKLGLKPQSINNWFARNTFDIDLVYSKCENISPDWLLSGKGDMLKTSPVNNKPLDQFQYTPTIPDSKKVDTTTSELTLYIRELVSKIESLSRENGKLQACIDMITNDLRASGGGGILHCPKTIPSPVDCEEPNSPADNPQR